MYSSLGQQIIDCLKVGPHQKTKIEGITVSAAAYLISNIVMHSQHSFAFVCQDTETATTLHQDIKNFLHLFSKSDLVLKLEFFPGWEHSPYSSLLPSIRDRIRRLKTLHSLSQNEVRILITDVKALTQHCPPSEMIQQRSFTLKIGETISREDLIAKLECAGFIRNDTVEDPGQYAIRGNLADIFSPSLKRPMRLEFFGDELESIRTYDPSSQRSDPQILESATIIPITNWAHTAQASALAKTNIKSFCDTYGISKQTRDEFFQRLELRDPNLDYLSPYFTMEGEKAHWSWIADYFPQNMIVGLFDSLAIEPKYDSQIKDLKKEFEKAIQNGGVVAPWEKLYIEPQIFNDFIKNKVRLHFDPIIMGTSEADKIQVHLVQNNDLRHPYEHQKFSLDVFSERASLWNSQNYVQIITAPTQSQVERIRFIFDQKNITSRIVEQIDWQESSILQITQSNLSTGFRLPQEKLAIVTDAEIFGPKKIKSTKYQMTEESKRGSFVSTLEELHPNDLIVHQVHGIGKYRGLIKLELDHVPQDFLLIEYAGSDKLYLPIYRLDQIQRYIGSQDSVALNKLGTNQFEKTKQKVKASLQALAATLLQLYAERASRQGFAFSPISEPYQEFEASFPYVETPDQLRAVEDMMKDMESPKIMDRLICGDVGYGKTEVAMRAAFRAISDRKQVAILVPTTVLALQHERSFLERFKDIPIHLRVLSRFKSPKEIKETIEGLKKGTVDLVIGTHRLFSKDVAFKDLGLLIIDEEQRFGVEHKERLKALKVTCDVLTLTATPIPRTLHMSLMGLRDISVINTAPIDRLSIRTYVSKFDEEVIKKAIEQELSRGGQVFFIHNRIQSIHAIADQLQTILPQARIIVAHGQLDERILENRMLDFYNKKGDVLLCSTIIESGLDIPSANTIIINRADMFGLAQLYQLRGRVGRSQLRAYCYLLLPQEAAITEEAKKRLEVIQRFVDLGSGFKIASHDLELRGGGDLLGKSQSGHIAAVGYELYTELLDETIGELKGQLPQDHFDPEIKLPVAALLPESYVSDLHQRIVLYQRLSQATSTDTLHHIELELVDRFGKPPQEVQNLISLIHLKQLLRQYHVKTLIVGKERSTFEPGEKTKLSPTKVLHLMKREPHYFSLTPDSKIIFKKTFQSVNQLQQELEKFFIQVADDSGAC